MKVAAPDAPSPSAPPTPPDTPEPAVFDPNKNLVYDVLFDVADLELVGRLKWDIFFVEQRLERALADSTGIPEELKRGLDMALELFRADEDVKLYKERFVRSEERLKLLELVRFLELAVKVREPLHAAWVRFLAWEHDRLLSELAGVDREGMARRPSAVLEGSRETEARRCVAVIVHTERSARQIFAEIPFRDYSRMISWYEEKNPALANLLAEARLLYLELGLVRQSTAMAREIRWAAVVMAVFTFVTASAALFGFLSR